MPKVALLVDDEQLVRDYVSTVLRQEGFKVLEAADGTDALSIVQGMRGTVDVLVTDVRMPRMTGIELVRSVKTDFPALPVIYISAEAFCDGLHDPCGHVLFLQKPFGPQAIRDAVRTVMIPEDTGTHRC